MFTMGMSYQDTVELYENNRETFRFYREMADKKEAEESVFRKAVIVATFGKLPN